MPELTALQPLFLDTSLSTEFASLSSSTLLPTFSSSPVRSLATGRLRPLDTIDMSSFTEVNTMVANLNLENDEVHSALKTVTANNSESESINFSKAMINNWNSGGIALSQSKEMVNWGRMGRKKDRAIVCKAFIEAKQTDLLIHNIGGMEKTDARKFMKGFFDNGGSNEEAYEWLAEAGAFLQKNNITEPTTDGLLGDIWGAITDAADWAWGAITTVVDAIDAALQDLGRAIGEIVNWTISKIAGVVRALIAAGKSVATILSTALSRGATALKRFVRAMIAGGQTLFSVITWVGSQVRSAIRNAVRGLISAGKTILQITKSSIRLAASAVRNIVQALIDLGHDVADMIRSVINASAARVKNLIDGFLRAGQQIYEILRETLSKAANAINNVMKALFDLGKTLAQVMLITLRNLGNSFMGRALAAMLAVGKRLADIISAGIQVAVGSVQKLIKELARLGQRVGDILDAVKTATVSVLTRVIQGLEDAGKRIASVLRGVSQFVGTQLKNMVSALYRVFSEAATIMVSFMRRGASVIRTILEGLFAAGLRFANAVAHILQNVAQEFQKSFISGLIALGHAVADIMREALLLTAALAALAFTAILEIYGGHRSLTTEEKEAARAIFGWSIDLDRIKIAAASLPADFILMVNGGRPFTTMHIINFSSKDDVTLRTLMHEMTHTWQGVEAGPVYMVEALHEQLTSGSGAYTITRQMLRDNTGNFARFGREQQARLVDMYYAYTLGSLKDDNDAADWVAALAPYARQVYKPEFSIGPIITPIDVLRPIAVDPIDPVFFNPITFRP